MSDLFIFFILLILIRGVEVILTERPPIFLLNIQTNRLYKKILVALKANLERDKEESKKEEPGSVNEYKEIIKDDNEGIEDLKILRNTVVDLITKYQDANKGYGHILRLWREYLSDVWEFAGIPEPLGALDVLGGDKAREISNKISANKKTLQDLSAHGDWKV